MADSMQTYEIVAGIFVFLTAILFASRARRYKGGFTAGAEGGHKEAEASWGPSNFFTDAVILGAAIVARIKSDKR